MTHDRIRYMHEYRRRGFPGAAMRGCPLRLRLNGRSCTCINTVLHVVASAAGSRRLFTSGVVALPHHGLRFARQ